MELQDSCFFCYHFSCSENSLFDSSGWCEHQNEKIENGEDHSCEGWKSVK